MNEQQWHTLRKEARQRLHELGLTLDESVREPYEKLVRTTGFLAEQEKTPLGPLPQIALELPFWVAEATGEEIDESVMLDLMESGLTCYLQFVLRDRFFVGGKGRAEDVLIVSDGLQVRHLSLLNEVTGSIPGFSLILQEKWLEANKALILHQRLLNQKPPHRPREYNATFQRFHPLMLPGLAVLAYADRTDWRPTFERMVRRLIRSIKVFRDLIDADKDLIKGNLTYIVRHYGGGEGVDQLRRKLIMEGGFDEAITQANVDLDAAMRAATEMRMLGALDWIDERRRQMEKIQEACMQNMMTLLVGL